MSTINGVSINLSNVNIANKFNNIYVGLPGTASNVLYDLGFDGLTIKLSGWTTSESEYAAVLAQFMKSGEQSLVIYDGWEYRVFTTNVSRDLTTRANYFAWSATLQTEDPYQYSLDVVSRTKTITSNNETWTSDDESNPIINTQVAAVSADVQITGSTGTTLDDDCVETHYIGTGSYTEHDKDVYTLKYSTVYDAQPGRSWHLTYIAGELRGFHTHSSSDVLVTYQIDDGDEVTLANWIQPPEEDNPWVYYYTDVDIESGENHSITLRYYMTSQAQGYVVHFRYPEYIMYETRVNTLLNARVYNTADSTVKLDMCNRLPLNSAIRLNLNGTGTYTYEDDFSGENYIDDALLYNGTVGVSSGALTIGESSYITYDIDNKYAIIGMPELTLNITSITGTPTVQIAADLFGIPDVFYDIDTALSSGEVTYGLDNELNLQLAGDTKFYFRIDCDAGESVTISDMDLNIDLNSSAASFFEIVGNGVTNTFRCDQDASSEMDCTVSMIYSERRWG